MSDTKVGKASRDAAYDRVTDALGKLRKMGPTQLGRRARYDPRPRPMADLSDPWRYVTLTASAQVGKTTLAEIFALASITASLARALR
jgi:hypothetical protein